LQEGDFAEFLYLRPVDQGLLKNPFYLGIEHCRHSGESRNDEQSRTAL